MTRILQALLVAIIATFATQANAIFLTPDWWDPTQPGVGTNRYAYSGNDPINRMDPSGNDSVWSNGDGTWSSSDGSTYDPNDSRNNSYDIGSDEYGYTVAPGLSPPELPGVQDINIMDSRRATVVTVTDRGISASELAMNPGHASIVQDRLERELQSQQPEAAAWRLVFETSVGALGGEFMAGASTVRGTVVGFRAVANAEAKDILLNGFRAGRNTLDGKWFTESFGQARSFLRDPRFGADTIVKGKVPRSVYERSFRSPNLDNRGPSFYIGPEDLPFIK